MAGIDAFALLVDRLTHLPGREGVDRACELAQGRSALAHRRRSGQRSYKPEYALLQFRRERFDALSDLLSEVHWQTYFTSEYSNTLRSDWAGTHNCVESLVLSSQESVIPMSVKYGMNLELSQLQIIFLQKNLVPLGVQKPRKILDRFFPKGIYPLFESAKI